MITAQDSFPPYAAMNCFFPMPFQRGARIEVQNECDTPTTLYFYVDYVERPTSDDDFTFHAHWRRESPTAATMTSSPVVGRPSSVVRYPLTAPDVSPCT